MSVSKIWRLDYAGKDGDFEFSMAADIQSANLIGKLPGLSPKESFEKQYIPRVMKWVDEKPRADLVPAPVSHFLLSKRARDLLEFAFAPNGGFYDAKIEDEEYFIYCCWNVIDALDHKESTFTTAGRPIKTVFRKDLLLPDVFTIPERLNFVFVCDTVKSVIETNGLTGFEFVEVGRG